MGGHHRTPRSGLAVLSWALFVGACSFDATVALEAAGNPDTLAPDAAPRPDAGDNGSAPDAAGDPDAAPSVADGVLQSFPRSQDIILDGVVDAAWQEATFVEFAIADAPLLQANRSYVPDATLRMASMYDAENLYFFIEVTDDSIVFNSNNIYDDDSIELTIDGLNDRSGPYNDDDHWLVVGAEGNYQSYGDAGIEATGDIVETAAGYNIELSLERADLGTAGNTTLGFNIALNDDDGQGGPQVDAYGVWYLPTTAECSDCCSQSTSFPWCDTTRLGQLELVP